MAIGKLKINYKAQK